MTTRRKRSLAIGAVTAMMTTIGLAGASPATAHNSTYCGHSFDGIVHITHYVHYHGNPQGQPGHQHHYYHDMAFQDDHEAHRYC